MGLRRFFCGHMFVGCAVEVGPQWLRHKLQLPIVGFLALQAANFDKCYRNWWLPTYSPTDQGGSGIESNTHSHTHTAHRCLGAGTQERIVTGENEQEPQISAYPIHPVIPQIPSNLSNRPNPNFTDLFLSLHYIHPRV